MKCEDCPATTNLVTVTVFTPHVLCTHCAGKLPPEVIKLATIEDVKEQEE